MAGKPGMHKKATITKDETLTVAARSNGIEKATAPIITKGGPETKFYLPEQAQEEKFLSEVLAGYSFWNKQQGDRAKAYAAAYRTLLNEFTAEETEK